MLTWPAETQEENTVLSPLQFRAPAERRPSVAAVLVGMTALLWSASAYAQTVDVDRVVSQLEPEIRRAMVGGGIPGLSVALVVGDEVVWARGFGYSNSWGKVPATTQTVYYIASTLKPITAAALLQQMEQGKFQLDDPVRNYLGDLMLRGEDPENPITFRHLLTHTSGLPSGGGGVDLWENRGVGSFEEYIREDLEVAGPPGEEVQYSNPAFALIAHLVEVFSGVPFADYVKENIWDPLGMDDTRFTPTPSMHERMAIPYVVAGDNGQLVPGEIRRRSYAWPAGSAFSTVDDMARWLIANLNNGLFNDHRVLSEETVSAMHTVQRMTRPTGAGRDGAESGYGLTWMVSDVEGDRHFSHSGSMTGYTNFISGNRDKRLGFLILTNGQRQHPQLIGLSDIALSLLQEHSRNP